jgi:hypothetical protein
MASDPKRKMDFATACDIAESADLPDGAYFAMIGDLMGIDHNDVMDLFAAGAQVPRWHDKDRRDD